MKYNGYYVNQIWELLRSRTVVQRLSRDKHGISSVEALGNPLKSLISVILDIISLCNSPHMNEKRMIR